MFQFELKYYFKYCGKPYEKASTVSYATFVLNFLSFVEWQFFLLNVVLVPICAVCQSYLRVYYSKPTILIKALLFFLEGLAYCGTLINVYFMFPCAIFTILGYFQKHRRVDVAFAGFLGVICLAVTHLSVNYYPKVFNNKLLFFDLDNSAVFSLNIMGTFLVITSNMLNRKSEVTSSLNNNHTGSFNTEWEENDQLLNSPFIDISDNNF